MGILLTTQAPFEGSVVMFLVSAFVTPIGACSQILIYGLVTKRRAFTLFDGVLSGIAAAAIIYFVIVAFGEPFLAFVSGYVFVSGVVLGGICALVTCSEVRPPLLNWFRRVGGGTKYVSPDSAPGDDK